MTPNEALQAAIKAVGGTSAELARRVGVTPQAIGQWDRVPAERVLAVEAATEHRVTRYQLRPDIYGPPPNFQRGGVGQSDQSASAVEVKGAA